MHAVKLERDPQPRAGIFQALDYFLGIKERDLPKYVLVSDFARFRLYDLEENTETEFHLDQ